MVLKIVFGHHSEIFQQIFIQGTLVIFVIGSFFSDNSTYLNVFKWIGIIYLVYLAYDIYKSRPENINSNEHYGKSVFFFC